MSVHSKGDTVLKLKNINVRAQPGFGLRKLKVAGHGGGQVLARNPSALPYGFQYAECLTMRLRASCIHSILPYVPLVWLGVNIGFRCELEGSGLCFMCVAVPL